MQKEKKIRKKLETFQDQLKELVENKIFDYRIRRDVAIQIQLLQWVLEDDAGDESHAVNIKCAGCVREKEQGLSDAISICVCCNRLNNLAQNDNYERKSVKPVLLFDLLQPILDTLSDEDLQELEDDLKKHQRKLRFRP